MRRTREDGASPGCVTDTTTTDFLQLSQGGGSRPVHGPPPRAAGEAVGGGGFRKPREQLGHAVKKEEEGKGFGEPVQSVP